MSGGITRRAGYGGKSLPDFRGKSGEILLGDFEAPPAGGRPRPDGASHTPGGYSNGGRPRPQGGPRQGGRRQAAPATAPGGPEARPGEARRELLEIRGAGTGPGRAA